MRLVINTLGSLAFLFKKRKIKEINSFEPKRILLIRSGSIGDVLMTTPLLVAIRKRFPKANIDYLVGEYSSSIIMNNPDINNIITFDENIIFKKKLGEISQLISTIKKNRYDLAFVLDKSWQWGAFASLCGIKYRIGFDRKGEGFANNLNVDFDGTKYELEYNNELAKLIGIEVKDSQMQFNISKEDRNFANEFIRKNKKKEFIVGIAPGGAKNPGQTMDVKRPPRSKYARLCNELIKEADIVLLGSKDDKESAEELAKLMKDKPIDMTGKMTLSQSAAVLEKCDLFISHDTGLMHIAAAMKTPQIALFGPTSPIRFAPRKAYVIAAEQKCKQCYDIYGKFDKDCKCIESIDIENAIKVARNILNLK